MCVYFYYKKLDMFDFEKIYLYLVSFENYWDKVSNNCLFYYKKLDMFDI